MDAGGYGGVAGECGAGWADNGDSGVSWAWGVGGLWVGAGGTGAAGGVSLDAANEREWAVSYERSRIEALEKLYCDSELARREMVRKLKDITMELNEAVYSGRPHAELAVLVDRLRVLVIVRNGGGVPT
jgi:hypothetical protein